jgi:fatty-acyl-CoA synthase
VFRATGDRWSYDEFARLVDRLAAGLLSIGVYKGDRVGIWAPNRPEWLLAQFATARIGAILVNINPAYRTARAGIRAEQGGRLHPDRGAAVQDLGLYGHAGGAGARTGPAAPPGGCAAAPARLAPRGAAWAEPAAPAPSFDEVMDRGGKAPARGWMPSPPG